MQQFLKTGHTPSFKSVKTAQKIGLSGHPSGVDTTEAIEEMMIRFIRGGNVNRAPTQAGA